MRLHRGQIPGLCRSIVKALMDGGDIEVADAREVERDLESVFNGYLNDLDRVLARARDLVQQRGLPQGEFARIKKLCADQAGIKVDDDALDYVLEQLIQMLMNSQHVDEVYGEDHAIKRRIRPFLRAEEDAEREIETEVRNQLKHVEEGSRIWEIEYERMKAEIKRRRGL
ncbi:MAG TPA: DUF507 family protein [Polyangiaceae bacterium]|jgi:hypothetical protein|nr:DUF507 family protein [Polyangiaceae bacterium]